MSAALNLFTREICREKSKPNLFEPRQVAVFRMRFQVVGDDLARLFTNASEPNAFNPLSVIALHVINNAPDIAGTRRLKCIIFFLRAGNAKFEQFPTVDNLSCCRSWPSVCGKD